MVNVVKRGEAINDLNFVDTALNASFPGPERYSAVERLQKNLEKYSADNLVAHAYELMRANLDFTHVTGVSMQELSPPGNTLLTFTGNAGNSLECRGADQGIGSREHPVWDWFCTPKKAEK